MSSTPLNQFDSHVRGAKTIPEMRIAIANASASVDKFGSTTEKRDAIAERISNADDEIVKLSLELLLGTFKASDSEARNSTYVAACKVVNGLVIALKEKFLEASEYASMNDAQLNAKLDEIRALAEISQRYVRMN